MSDIKVEVIEGPDFVVHNPTTPELLEKVFDVANEWTFQEILKINEDLNRRVVGIRLSFHESPLADDKIVALNVAIASDTRQAPKQDPAKAHYESEIQKALKA